MSNQNGQEFKYVYLSVSNMKRYRPGKMCRVMKILGGYNNVHRYRQQGRIQGNITTHHKMTYLFGIKQIGRPE